jgi:hypothetical protein
MISVLLVNSHTLYLRELFIHNVYLECFCGVLRLLEIYLELEFDCIGLPESCSYFCPCSCSVFLVLQNIQMRHKYLKLLQKHLCLSHLRLWKLDSATTVSHMAIFWLGAHLTCELCLVKDYLFSGRGDFARCFMSGQKIVVMNLHSVIFCFTKCSIYSYAHS